MFSTKNALKNHKQMFVTKYLYRKLKFIKINVKVIDPSMMSLPVIDSDVDTETVMPRQIKIMEFDSMIVKHKCALGAWYYCLLSTYRMI